MVRIRGRATAEVLAIVLLVFAAQLAVQALAPALAVGLFALSTPVWVRPWTVVTSVYAHGSVGHLVSNAIGILLFGLVVERVSTRLRFHLFFLLVGAAAAVSQVLVQSIVADGVAVLGASGAVMGLLGYLLAGNALTRRVVGGLSLSTRQQALVFGVLAVGITLATMGPRVAVVGHFVGLALGLIAGRLRLLHVRR